MMKLGATRNSASSEEPAVNIGLPSRPAYKALLSRLFVATIVGVFFYAFLNHLPDFAQVIILLAALVIIWWHADFPKRTTPSYPTLLFWLPLTLGIFCGLMWKITAEDIWVRLGIACICVRAFCRIIEWADVWHSAGN
jgi:hypothetical protein